MNNLKPSHFTSFPFGSILRRMEDESVALSIMRMRARNGDTWPLTHDRYCELRQAEGCQYPAAEGFFDEVIGYIPDAIGAISFSPAWARDARSAEKEAGL